MRRIPLHAEQIAPLHILLEFAEWSVSLLMPSRVEMWFDLESVHIGSKKPRSEARR